MHLGDLHNMSDFSWGALLNDLRRENGISQRGLAQKTGLSRSTIRCIESGGFKQALEPLETLLDFYGYELEAVIKDDSTEI